MANTTRLALALAVVALWPPPALADDSRITLLPLQTAPVGDGLGPHWSPTPAQADEALAFLAGYLNRLDRQTGLNRFEQIDQQGVRRRFPAYRYQAYGVTAPPGNKMPGLAGARARLVVLNAACEESDEPGRPGWKTGPVYVLDGGPCYFRLFYDIDGKRLAWLSVNGAG